MCSKYKSTTVKQNTMFLVNKVGLSLNLFRLYNDFKALPDLMIKLGVKMGEAGEIK